MLDVTLLGTGGGMPLPGRYLSATLITYRGNKILIDCGEGTQVSMREINSGFKSIDMICITHIHGDHIIGLPGLLLSLIHIFSKNILHAVITLVIALVVSFIATWIIGFEDEPVDCLLYTSRCV